MKSMPETISKEEIQKVFQDRIDAMENQEAEMFGQKLYKSADGFSQEQIYEFCGRSDSVAGLTFAEGSESFKQYPEGVTVRFYYTQKDRKMLEEDATVLDNVPMAKAELLLDGGDIQAEMRIVEISTKEITQLLVVEATKKCNTFFSKDPRVLNLQNILFEPYGKRRDIGWMYGALSKAVSDGIALTPDEENQRLAYKLILEHENLTDEELSKIFDENSRIVNKEVAYHCLIWKRDAGYLSDKNLCDLQRLSSDRFWDRLSYCDAELKNMGLSIQKLINKYPEKATLIYKRLLNFHQIRYNVIGHHLLFLDLKGFLHIYLRHVKELNIDGSQFDNRDKFQLFEEDVLITMSHVMKALNNEYQQWKEKNPNGRFSKYGEQAYYYNGDYYNVVVNADGSVSTFYKCTGKK